MQAVILAAGRGTRMDNLTIDTPKPLLLYKGKTLLEQQLESLPEEIDQVVIIIGYLGRKIEEIIGDTFKNKKILYVADQELQGTGKALWQAKDKLNESFVVMMGDDLYSRESISLATKEKWSITIKEVARESESHRVEMDSQGKLIGFMTADKYRNKYTDGGYAFTGMYTLSKDIFKYQLVKLKTKEEWGLPQTLLQIVPNIDLKILKTDYWKQFNTPEDFKN